MYRYNTIHAFSRNDYKLIVIIYRKIYPVVLFKVACYEKRQKLAIGLINYY